MRFSKTMVACVLVASLAGLTGCAATSAQSGSSAAEATSASTAEIASSNSAAEVSASSSEAAPSSRAGAQNAADARSSSQAAQSSSASAPDDESKAGEETRLAITANGTTFTAAFEDNSSAAAFVALLQDGPITVSAHDYGKFEKVGSLPQSLPTNDAQITTQPGDVILYQGNQVTIYYDQNTWSFTRLAHIDGATRESLLSLLGDGDVELTFALA